MANHIAADRDGARLLFHSSQLNIAVSTAYRVYTIFEQTDNIDPKRREYTAITIDERVTQAILAIV